LPTRRACAWPRFIGGTQAIRLDETRWLLALDGHGDANWQQLPDIRPPRRSGAGIGWKSPPASRASWPATQEAFVPQMLNMELPAVGGEFHQGLLSGPGNRGPHPIPRQGQAAQLSRRAEVGIAAMPGTHVYAPETGEQHCGAIVSLAPSPAGGHECLVCVQIGAVEAGDVHVGSPTGERLEFPALPYAQGS
jgi:hypothetical protein